MYIIEDLSFKYLDFKTAIIETQRAGRLKKALISTITLLFMAIVTACVLVFFKNELIISFKRIGKEVKAITFFNGIPAFEREVIWNKRDYFNEVTPQIIIISLFFLGAYYAMRQTYLTNPIIFNYRRLQALRVVENP